MPKGPGPVELYWLFQVVRASGGGCVGSVLGVVLLCAWMGSGVPTIPAAGAHLADACQWQKMQTMPVVACECDHRCDYPPVQCLFCVQHRKVHMRLQVCIGSPTVSVVQCWSIIWHHMAPWWHTTRLAGMHAWVLLDAGLPLACMFELVGWQLAKEVIAEVYPRGRYDMLASICTLPAFNACTVQIGLPGGHLSLGLFCVVRSLQ
jgi:hypothetical protein